MTTIWIVLLLILSMVLTVEMLSQKTSYHMFIQSLRIIFALYLLANLYVTLLSRTQGDLYQLHLIPFHSYTKVLHFHESHSITLDGEWFPQIILNILLYVPMGYLMPMVFSFAQKPIKYFIWIGFCLSLSTELMQLIFRLGWFEIDDLIHNTFGTIVGIWLYQMRIGSKTKVHVTSRKQRFK